MRTDAGTRPRARAGRGTLPPNAGDTLLSVARSAIGERLGILPALRSDAGWLLVPGASFVTLRLRGELRGCVGTLDPHRPLGEDVQANAVAAAFRDSRFLPLGRDEFDRVRVEVSVLSPIEPLAFGDEEEALEVLRPGLDGVVFQRSPPRHVPAAGVGAVPGSAGVSGPAQGEGRPAARLLGSGHQALALRRDQVVRARCGVAR